MKILRNSLIILIFFLSFASSVFALEIFESEYTGNSGANRDIAHGLSGAPNICSIKGESTTDAIFQITDFADNVTLSWRQDSPEATEGIESLGATNLRIDADGHVNQSGVTYSVFCVLCAGDGDCEVGEYEGNGTDNTDISLSTVTTLSWLGIKNKDAGDSGSHRFGSSTTTDASMAFHEFSSERSNEIQDFGSGTFEIGTAHNVNASAETYAYFAVGTDDGVCVGSYDGNSTDDTDITACGLDPELVFVKSLTDLGDSYMVHATDGISAGESVTYSFVANFLNGIQDTSIGSADGFQVGDDDSVNLQSVYFYLGITDTPVVSDTCTYTSGDWEVLYSDNCEISSNISIDQGGDFFIIRDGAGSFQVTAGAIIEDNDGAILLQSPVDISIISSSNGVLFKR